MNSELLFRVGRITDAVGQTRLPSTEFSSLLPSVVVTEKSHVWFQDFSGGQSEARLYNLLQQAIAAVAGLEDILAEHFPQSPSAVERIHHCFQTAPALKVLKELWNTDKHGKIGRKGALRTCWVEDVRRILRTRTGDWAGSWMNLGFARTGAPVVFGDGTSDAVVTGEIHYRNLTRTDDAYTKIMSGLDEVDVLMLTLGIFKKK